MDGRNIKPTLARVCDPAAVPANYQGIRIAATDTLGASVSFPSEWLIKPMNKEALDSVQKPLPVESVPAASVVDAFRQAVLPHIHEFDLNAERVAEICGLSKRTLARRLQSRGTSVREEIIELRRARAEKELGSTD